MSGARRMQELQYLRGGATLVISLDGLSRLSGWRCSDKGDKKRDEELWFWKSSGQMVLADERLLPTTCLCILDQRGSGAFNLRRSAERRWSLVTRSSSFSLSPRHCFLEEPFQHSVFTSLASAASVCPAEVAWTRPILNMWEAVTLATQQHAVKIDGPNTLIVVCDEDTGSRSFSDMRRAKDCTTFVGNTDCHITDNEKASSVLQESTANSPADPNNNSEDDRSEGAIGDNFNWRTRRGLLTSCQNDSHHRSLKMRKSVSFDDDVTVYLFDQESPTVKLRPEPHTFPSTSTCNLPDVSLEDSGLEWEDDFSALEKNRRFQCDGRSQHNAISWPTAFSRPGRYSLSQTCLFLTHVTESDLEP